FHLENIIIEARKSLILVSPYLQLSKILFERLKEAHDRSVNITIVYGKVQLDDNEKSSLSALENLGLYFLDNLHAKCYFNETNMIITSMNMYDFSEKNKREMGVLINRTNDCSIFDKAVAEVQSIVKASQKVSLKLTRLDVPQKTGS